MTRTEVRYCEIIIILILLYCTSILEGINRQIWLCHLLRVPEYLIGFRPFGASFCLYSGRRQTRLLGEGSWHSTGLSGKNASFRFTHWINRRWCYKGAISPVVSMLQDLGSRGQVGKRRGVKWKWAVGSGKYMIVIRTWHSSHILLDELGWMSHNCMYGQQWSKGFK